MEILFLFFEELLYYFPLVTITLNTSLYSEPFPIYFVTHIYSFVSSFCVVCVYMHMNIRGQCQIYSPVVRLLIIEMRLHRTHH